MAVTPIPGVNSTVVTGGTPVTAVNGGPNGGFITNPYTAATPLFVNPVTAATTTSRGTTFALQPGDTWDLIPGQTTPTSVNSTDSGHTFSVVSW